MSFTLDWRVVGSISINLVFFYDWFVVWISLVEDSDEFNVNDKVLHMLRALLNFGHAFLGYQVSNIFHGFDESSFKPFLEQILLLFIDDILVYSKS